MSNYEINIISIPVELGGGFAAQVPTLPGCMSDGETAQEAFDNALAAIDDWIEEANRLGMPIPEPDIQMLALAFG